MKKKSFGFGIVGAGAIAHFHARAILNIQNADLIGIYSINKSKSVPFAETHQCEVFDSLEDLLGHPQIDVVCICTPSGIHLEPALQSMKAGKHCLIEKPLEVTLERCDQIIEAADKAGVKVGVIFPSRFYADNQKVKKAVDASQFGDLVLGDAYVKWSRTTEYYQSAKWRGTWQFDGGGALMNQGIHSVDLLQWYMGDVEFVQAIQGNRKHKDLEVEDTVVSAIQFRNGAMGTIEASTATYPGAPKRIEIMGTKGTAVIEDNQLIRYAFADGVATDQSSLAGQNQNVALAGGASDPANIDISGHKYQILDMIESIETGKAPYIDAKEGRKSVEIILAIYESARTGKRIALSPAKQTF